MIPVYTGDVPDPLQPQPEFDENVEDFVNYIATLVPELNEFAGQLNTFSTTATSTTSNSIATGNKTFTVEAGKSFFTGMSLRAVNSATNYMNGEVVSYSGTTLVINVKSFKGTGTFATWVIFQSQDSLISTNQLNPAETFGRLINRRVITASEVGTAYTAGAKKARVILCGGGGGGGGVDGINPGAGNAESGSGAGQTEKFFTITTPDYDITIGAGGLGGAAGANNGQTGGTTTFDDGVNVLTATGGQGGLGLIGTTGSSIGAGTSAGEGTGGDINLKGSPATNRTLVSGNVASFSVSGCTPYWGGGKRTPASTPTNGENATNAGEGGSGAHVTNSTVDRAGGNGFRGEVILEEYA